MTVIRIISEISAVSKIFYTVFICCFDTLINPIPDKAALKTGIFIPKRCIFIRTSAGVAHCMRVFTKNIRSFILSRYSIFLTFPRLCIHFRLNIRKLFFIRSIMTFKMDKTAFIGILNPFIHFLGNIAAKAFITKTPANNTCMIFISVIKSL